MWRWFQLGRRSIPEGWRQPLVEGSVRWFRPLILHRSTVGYLVSGILHVLGVVAAHSWLSGVGPLVWPVQTGVSSLQLRASMAQESTESQQPGWQVVVDEEPAAGGGAEELKPQDPPRTAWRPEHSAASPRWAVTPDAAQSLPEPRLPERMQDELDRSTETAVADTPPRGSRRLVPPPTVSTVAALDSQFAAGELKKTLPQPRYNPAPVYPPQLLAAQQSGVVLLLVEISPQGSVARCAVQQSSGFAAFDEAAMQAVTTWQFVPASRFGIPVATRILCPIRFQFMEGTEPNPGAPNGP